MFELIFFCKYSRKLEIYANKSFYIQTHYYNAARATNLSNPLIPLLEVDMVFSLIPIYNNNNDVTIKNKKIKNKFILEFNKNA